MISHIMRKIGGNTILLEPFTYCTSRNTDAEC
jgi:hypothetical protein